MEAKGRLTNISLNVDTGRTCLTFEMDSLRPDSIEDIRECPLRIKAAKWREKRSLTANAYFHVLVARIAEAVGASNIEIKNDMINRYGFPEIPGIQMILREKDDWRKLEGVHLHPTSATKILGNGELYRVYYMMRGSSTYDSKEFSRLLDGTISEAKELGIETLPKDEINRMLEALRGGVHE